MANQNIIGLVSNPKVNYFVKVENNGIGSAQDGYFCRHSGGFAPDTNELVRTDTITRNIHLKKLFLKLWNDWTSGTFQIKINVNQATVQTITVANVITLQSFLTDITLVEGDEITLELGMSP